MPWSESKAIIYRAYLARQAPEVQVTIVARIDGIDGGGALPCVLQRGGGRRGQILET